MVGHALLSDCSLRRKNKQSETKKKAQIRGRENFLRRHRKKKVKSSFLQAHMVAYCDLCAER